ncbi:hypothetical protein [Candidatus Cetobacterium colombiensis]|uniref:Zinc resistance-associated protein n=1 Tax=Candidatus Cetobacterium colombiensis TaxID=3073100 RepID=A0ABU4W6V5_9FUSO|nr:hypothetical protein [Candidatus Cetobacterium colombiensis]MDX8335253.1 hypothetical protein [Candidatus Cetobacterium colombiensis]
MKKYVLICSLILSALTFGATNSDYEDSVDGSSGNNMPMMQTHHNNSSPCNMMQQMPGWKADKKMMKSRMMYMTPEMQKNMIDIEQKELDIRKAMLDDKVDWNKVEKLNKEIGEIRAKMQTDMMKKNYESMKAAPTDPANKQ